MLCSYSFDLCFWGVPVRILKLFFVLFELLGGPSSDTLTFLHTFRGVPVKKDTLCTYKYKYKYKCRYEVRVVAISSAGQAAVERAVYTLTAGVFSLFKNLFSSARFFSSFQTTLTGGDAVSLRSPSPPLPTASQGERAQVVKSPLLHA